MAYESSDDFADDYTPETAVDDYSKMKFSLRQGSTLDCTRPGSQIALEDRGEKEARSEFSGCKIQITPGVKKKIW